MAGAGCGAHEQCRHEAAAAPTGSNKRITLRDEIIHALEGVHNTLINIEESEEQELERVRTGYSRLAEDARANENGDVDDISAEVRNGIARLKG